MYDADNFFENLKSNNLSYRRFKQIVSNIIRKNYYTRLIFGFDSQKSRNGLAIFVVRENALEIGLLDRIIFYLKKFGFVILETKILSKEEKIKMTENTRGGNWSCYITGKQTKPEACIVVFDPNPIRLPIRFYGSYSKVDNGRLIFKRTIRSRLNKELNLEQRRNFTHATDNATQAWKYIRMIMPERENEIREQLRLKHPVCPSCGPGVFLSEKGYKIICSKCLYVE